MEEYWLGTKQALRSIQMLTKSCYKIIVLQETIAKVTDLIIWLLRFGKLHGLTSILLCVRFIQKVLIW